LGAVQLLLWAPSNAEQPIHILKGLLGALLGKAGASHSSALDEVHFQLPSQIDGVILFNQPCYDLCKINILFAHLLPVRHRQGPFQHPFTSKSLFSVVSKVDKPFVEAKAKLVHQYRVHVDTKFIKILFTQVTRTRCSVHVNKKIQHRP